MSKEKKQSYWEQLQDPRWQRKRLEIMQRDNFTCRRCSDDSTTLNVHHTYYERGADPWDYPDYSLHTFCKPCHEIVQSQMAELHRSIGLLQFDQLEELSGYAKGLASLDPSANDTPHTVKLENAGEVDGFVRVIMTHTGPGSRVPITEAGKRLIQTLMSSGGTTDFVEAFFICFPNAEWLP